MFRLASPTLLWLLLLIPVFGIFAKVWMERRQRQVRSLFGSKMYSVLSASVSKEKRKWKVFLKSLGLVFLITALSRPQMGQKSESVKNEGVEMILAVDVSESMLAEDIKPSRLEQVKVQLSHLLELMPNNKIGIVAFAGSAALVCPLTQDLGALRMYLDSLSPSMISTQGTHFLKALSVAEKAFEAGGVTKDDRHHVTRVIVLASDGEDHEAGALEKAEDLARRGVIISALAYGTKAGGTIPIRDSMGYSKGEKRNHSGERVITKVEGEALSALAKAGKGNFYFANYDESHLRSLVKDIENLEKSEFSSTTTTEYGELYQPFLFMGFILILIGFYLGERKLGANIWRGRFEVPQE